MRIFVATLRKLVRRPATWVTLGLMVGLLALILIVLSVTIRGVPGGTRRLTELLLLTFPTAYLFILSFILLLGGLLSVLYAASVAGSEWGWGTLKAAVARGESRWRYTLASFAAVAVLLGAGILVAYTLGVGLDLLAGRIAGVDSGSMGDSAVLQKLPEQMGRTWLVIVEQAAIGFAIATVARSQLAGIGVGIGLYFGEQFATIFLPDQVRYLPFHVANAAVDLGAAASGAGGGAAGGAAAAAAGALTADEALALVVAWLIGALLVSCLFTDRSEIPG
jgi:ABC-2 type transport system permease protein